MMTDNDNLNYAFQACKSIKLEELHNETANERTIRHLDEETRRRLAGSGGLETATAAELEHLDDCPLCLAQWAAWRRALTAADEDFVDDFNCELDQSGLAQESFSHQAFGYLEAAASDTKKTRPLVLESSCGSYRLEILPDRQENNEGMIILSRLSGKQKPTEKQNPTEKPGPTENQRPIPPVTVRDRAGLIIISGALENNRLARIRKNLNELDLSIWTVA